jgi:hypothetical protein
LSTFLEIITNVGNRAGYTVDSVVIASVDQTTVQLRAMANDVIKRMAYEYEWPQLFKTGTITLANGVSTYALPADFSSYHFDSFWNQSTHWRIFGPLSESDYATIQGYGLVAYPYGQFQLRGVTDDEFYIYPTPTSAATVVFEYMAARFVRPRTWVVSTAFAAGSYCFYNGNYYTTTAGGTTGPTPPTHTSGTVWDGGVLWTYYDGAYEGFLADTDVPVFLPLVLEQGILESFAAQHGIPCELSYETDLADAFSRKVPGQMIYAGDAGSGILQMARGGVVSFGKGFGPAW